MTPSLLATKAIVVLADFGHVIRVSVWSKYAKGAELRVGFSEPQQVTTIRKNVYIPNLPLIVWTWSTHQFTSTKLTRLYSWDRKTLLGRI